MTVERVRAGEVLRLERRAVALEPQEEYVEIGVRSFGRGIFHKDPVDGASLGNKRVFRIEPEDLVISNVFAWEGAIAVASCDEAGTIGSHRFMTFVPTDDRIDIGWASWFFRSEPGLELIRRASPGSAGRNRTLAIDRFEALEISLPPTEEQRDLAARLDELGVRTAELSGRLSRREAMVAALMPSLRRDAIGAFTDHAPLSEVVEVEMGQSPPGGTYNQVGAGLPLLNGPTEFGKETPIPRQWTTAATKVSEPGDLLICVRGATTGRMNWSDRQYCIGRGLAALRPRRGVLDGAFLRHVLLHLAPTIMSRTAGSTFANLARAKLLGLPIPVPDLGWQRVVAARLDGAEQAVSDMVGPQGRARALIRAVLPAALNEAFAGLS